MKGTVLIAVLALAACGQGAPSATAPPAPAAARAPPFDLTCEAFADVTAASLGQLYGEANVSVQTLPGPEGTESYQATVLFADDAARRVEIVWNDATDHPASIVVYGAASQWRGPGGLTLGVSVEAVQQANGGAFTMNGFDWDYGGLVTDWRGGAFSKAPCHISMGFDPHGQNYAAEGDSEFASNSPAVAQANATLARMGLNYPDE